MLGDRQVRMIVLLALVIYALIYPLPYRAELLRDVPVVLVDQDGSTASADLARRVDASEAVALTHLAPTWPRPRGWSMNAAPMASC
ncbi:hypothetical protein FLP41_01130 (plasmid) [Paracoccus marcusii]|uniref:hypothetical protein n=1 Tax=Paracoccus marcusii TaxID=59779 RepID=UPI0012F07879|nr:hypothetical protein FLP41_01130 [Paracoccus marcusii]